ncbi:MAG: glycosyltransferase family 2 protein [Hyphomonadaceae bacterium]|nr:glycosyltransferase family 2 protein [Hyphomonadaceae bacterium]
MSLAECETRTETSSDALELTILMPCLNEAETIAVCVEKAMGFLQRSNIAGEVVIADNGSTDGSQEIATRLGARVVPVPVRGYGAALLGGIAAARGRYVIMGDADDSYDFTALDAFVEKLRAGHDLVMGNRFKGGIAPGAMPPLHKYFGNPVLSWLGRFLFRVPIGDFHCGLRGFNTASMRRLGLVTSGMEFASEMVLRSGLEGLSIAEVPTTLKPDGRSRPPHLKSFRDGWRHLKLLLMYSPKWLFIFPGALLLTVGGALMTMLWFGPLSIGDNIQIDINTYAAACFMAIAGVQLVSFGVLARYYATLTGMLPRGRRSDFLYRFATTDTVVRIGALSLAAGAGVFGYALWSWSNLQFGDLSHMPHIARAVLSGLSFIVISIQLGFGAFMIGILKIPLAARAADLPSP